MKSNSKEIRMIESGDMLEIVHSENEAYKTFYHALLDLEKEIKKDLNKENESKNLYVNDIILEFRQGRVAVRISTGDRHELNVFL